MAGIAGLGLAACTFAPEIVFADHTGRGFALSMDGHRASVPALGLHAFRYSGEEGPVTIRQGRCRYLYEVPDHYHVLTLLASPAYRHVAVQLEPDMRIYLMPGEATAPLPVETLAPLQKGGFPLSPILAHCDDGPAPAASAPG